MDACRLRPGRPGRLALVAALGVWLAGAAGAGAQPEQYPLSRSHVAENDAASEEVHAARKHLANHRIARAVEHFQNAIDRYGDYVILTGEGLYENVTDVCRRALSELPPEGRAAYLDIYESHVRAQAEAAGAARNLAALGELPDRYPLSPAAHRAAARLGAFLLERGDVATAIPHLERAVAFLTPADAPLAAAHLGYAYARSGRRDGLLDLIRRVREAPPELQVLQGDRAVPLLLLLQTLFDRLSAPAANLAPAPRPLDRWPTYGGDLARSRLMQPGLELVPRVWNFPLAPSAVPRSSAVHFPGFRDTPPEGVDALPPYFPVLADGTVYLHNETSVHALDLVSKRPDRQWSFETGLGAEDVLHEKNALHTLTLDGSRLFANLVTSHEERERQLDWLDVKYNFPLRALFAFDITTGKILWKVGGIRESDDFALRASFAMAPAVVGPDVYAAAIFNRVQTDPITHYLACLDAATGRVRWKTEICSGFGEMNLFNNPTRESVGSAVSVYGSGVYYCSNLGVIACVDRHTGRRRWLRRYNQFPIQPVRDVYPDSSDRSSWANNPIAIRPGYLFVTPTDSPYLYCLDPETGAEKWTWDRQKNAERLGESQVFFPTWLAGVTEEAVIVTGGGATALAFAKGGTRLWTWRPPDNRPPAGAPALTPDALYVPGRQRLYRINLTTGRSDESWRWAAPTEDAGNLLLADHAILSASGSGLSAFFLPEEVEKRFAAELAAAPDDPFLRARVAAGLAKTGAYDQAVAQWTRVLELAQARPGAELAELALRARRSLHRLHLEAGRARWRAGNREEALLALTAARSWSPDPRGALEALFTAYDFLREAGRWKDALAVMADVLRSFPDEVYGRATARDAAKSEIDRVLAQAGRTPYAEQEAAAETLLRGAGAAPAEGALLELLRLFPNSLAAESAALALARDYRAQGRADEAVERLRGYIKDYPKSEHAPEAYALLIEVFEEKRMVSSARGLLAQLARKFPTAALPEGRGSIPVKTWVERRLARPEYVEGAAGAGRAEFAGPATESWRRIEGPTARVRLLPADGPGASLAAEPLGFAAVSDLLVAFDLATGQDVWKKNLEGGPRRMQLHERTLIVLGRFALLGLDAETGAELWRYDPEDYVTELYLSRGTLFLTALNRNAQGESKLIAVDAAKGRKQWEFPVGGSLAELFLTDEFAALSVPANHEVLVVERETGKLAHSIAVAQGTVRVFPLEPDKLAVLGGNQLAAYELASGRRLWREVVGNIAPEQVTADGPHVCFVSPAHELVALDVETGRALVRQPIADLKSVRLLQVEGGTAYLVYRTPPQRGGAGQLQVAAFSLKDGKRLWATPTAEEGLRAAQEPILTPRHFLLVSALFDSSARLYAPRVVLIDRADGSVVQTLAPDFPSTTPPRVMVQGNTLLMCSSNGLAGFRKP
ncbi:MAG: PQQ-binding-like beta-propeller repeat protein [Planctomycetes bacterium]|nr:PQQ-binding-like beta-propeller repeat protein [Planctomycetota bacterium]